MVFTEPYKQNNYTVYPGDVRTTNLSFAVWLIDDHTKGNPIGKINVQIKGINKKAVRNLSGYYLFVDLDQGEYSVSIDSDYYFPKEIKIDTLSFPDEKNPVLEIILKPKPDYPFS